MATLDGVDGADLSVPPSPVPDYSVEIQSELNQEQMKAPRRRERGEKERVFISWPVSSNNDGTLPLIFPSRISSPPPPPPTRFHFSRLRNWHPLSNFLKSHHRRKHPLT